MEASIQPVPATLCLSTDRVLSLKQSWYLIAMLFVWQLVAAIPYGLLEGIGHVAGFTIPKGVSISLVYALAFGLTIWGALRKRTRQVAFTAVNPLMYPVIAIGTVAFAFVLEPLVAALPVPGWLQKILEQTFTKDVIWSAVLLAPVLEEILFRGIILDGLLKRYSPTKAIVWSAIMFGVVHLNPAQSLGAFALGVPLGWLYYRTGSLWPCIVLHFVNNALGSLPLLGSDALNMSANTTRSLVNNDGLYASLMLICLLICYGCYYALNRLMPRRVD